MFVPEDIQQAVKAALGETVRETVEAAVKNLGDSGTGAPVTSVAERSDDDESGGFKSFAHFARDVARASVAGAGTSKELAAWSAKTAGHMQEGDDSQGGFLVPEEFRNTLLKNSLDAAIVRPRATVIPMATNSVKIPFVNETSQVSSVYGGVVIYRASEASQISASNPTFGQVELSLNKVTGLVYVSSELLEDSPISMEPLLTAMFSEAISFQEDDDYVNGTGTGMPLGIINAPCTITLDKESEQADETILWENIVKMWSRLHPRCAAKAVWLANPDTFPPLATMTQAVGSAGVPVYLPAHAAADAPYGTLMGRPLILTKKCQTLGDKGDIILADFSQYLVGTKARGLQVAQSIHLRFDYDQTAFRFTLRYDGQPWWPAALTPKYSTSTLSPFVTLGARSAVTTTTSGS
ncbi:MAG: phage major capsid protein [Planctomycetes bacterium]|nr:phage major capsid protein [Planctomycetota bacterium]